MVPPSCSRTLSIAPNYASVPIQQLPATPATHPPPPAATSPESTCVCESESSSYFLWVTSHPTCLFATGSFHPLPLGRGVRARIRGASLNQAECGFTVAELFIQPPTPAQSYTQVHSHGCRCTLKCSLPAPSPAARSKKGPHSTPGRHHSTTSAQLRWP